MKRKNLKLVPYHGFNHSVLKYKITKHLEHHDDKLIAQREGKETI